MATLTAFSGCERCSAARTSPSGVATSRPRPNPTCDWPTRRSARPMSTTRSSTTARPGSSWRSEARRELERRRRADRRRGDLQRDLFVLCEHYRLRIACIDLWALAIGVIHVDDQLLFA